ncbi:MAG TPA: bacteriohemerythrin [Ignavibacteriaceae bacterium]
MLTPSDMPIHEMLMPWSTKYHTGHPKIDIQHEKLVWHLNRVAFGIRHATEDVMQELWNAVQFVKTHFATEDKLMTQSHFPDLDKHRKIHFHLIAELNNLYQRTKNGSIAPSEETNQFLKDWLVHHIDKSDRELAGFAMKHLPNSL